MSVSGVGARSQLAVQSIVDMRRQIDELQRQLGTGKQSTTYAGLAGGGQLSVGLRAQLSDLESYAQSMTLVRVRLDAAETALTRLAELGVGVKGLLQQPAAVKPSGRSGAQENARMHLAELLDLLNSRAGDRYLFGGRATDRPAVQDIERILGGDGARAGLELVIAERRLADFGADGLGRLAAAAAAATVSLSEDAAGSPFGFKLRHAGGDISGASVSGPSGAPPAIAVAFASVPNAGESISFTLALPDGTEETLTLTATAAAPPGAGEFTLGADASATAQNLAAALQTSLSALARTSLRAASAAAAAEDFFDIGAGDPPRRVAGPPFETATALTAGTEADTVFWYTGEMGSDSARAAATARIDAATSVSYGMRANEAAIRSLVQNVAAFVAASFDPADPAVSESYAALAQRLAPALTPGPGAPRIEDIEAELAGAGLAIEAARDRQQQTRHVLEGLLDHVEGVAPEQTAAQLLALQTRLQCSLQMTATLYQLNLADFI